MSLLAKIPSPPIVGVDLLHVFDGGKEEKNERRGRFFPAEWFPQSGVQLTWPHAGTDWKEVLDEVTACYIKMAFEISMRELLLIVTPHPEEVSNLLTTHLPKKANENIRYVACPTNDTWARDHAFLTVIDGGGIRLLDFGFNGWGNKFAAELDNAINKQVFASGLLQGAYTDCLHFIFEGGSIESDGQGTLLTTSQCLLSPERNPNLDKEGIETYLKETLFAERILWLNHGALIGDDTDSHVDTLARFCSPASIAYVQCTDSADPQYAELKAMEEELKAFRTADDKPYELIPLPMPTAIEADGERLPATYANFLILNGSVLYPTYAQPELDEKAKAALQDAFPKREIIGIDCRILIKQHGSLHCSTMQFPRGVINYK